MDITMDIKAFKNWNDNVSVQRMCVCDKRKTHIDSLFSNLLCRCTGVICVANEVCLTIWHTHNHNFD